MPHHFRSRILLMILATCFPVLSAAQGLKFVGMERPIEERTSYNVFGSEVKSFTDVCSISFRLTMYPEAEFGYIMRIRSADDKSYIWNMSYDGMGEDIEIRINEEYRYSLLIAKLKRDEMRYSQWYDIKLKMDFRRDSLYLDIGEKRFSAYLDFDEEVSVVRPIITFGKSDHIIDVPSFAIRDLCIKEERRGGKRYYFPLDASSGNIVDDDSFNVQGRVENPVWLIGESMKWKHEGRLQSGHLAAAGYNLKEKSFYMISRDSVYLYNPDIRRYTYKKMDFSCPVEMYTGTSVVSPVDSCIYVYELFNDQRTSDSPTVARLNKVTKEWEPLCYEQMERHMHHHAPFFLPESDRLCFFGGFGSLLYNGDFYALDADSLKWDPLWKNNSGGGSIFPRYFTSVGLDSEHEWLYVFGGMGNECGEQIVGRRYFYDLHRIRLSDGTSEKLWELDWTGDNVVPVRQMLVMDGYIYVLCYPEYLTHSRLKLYRFSIVDGTYETYCDEIPIFSDRINTNACMYYDEQLKKLLVTTQEFKDDIGSVMNIYTLSFPPVVYAKGAWGLWFRRNRILVGILTALLLVLLVSVVLYLKQRARADSSVTSGSGSRRCFVPERHSNSIQVFGDFKVIDPDGNDISNIFTGQQQMIFLLLLKRFNENGMSSKRLSNILWPDKDEDKVKNSRGVAINNLRKSLSHLKGVSITFFEGRYRLEVDDTFYCDYLRVLPVLIGESTDLSEALCVFSKGGKFLSLATDPVFDSFKDNVETRIIELLHMEIQKRFDNKEYKAVIEIADMLMNVDSLDEAALKYGVWSLRKLKMNEEARMRYSEFASEYRLLYEQDYSISYNEL